MTTITKWSGVAIAIQSALAAAATIAAISKANPGAVSSTAHGMLDGAYAKMTVSGMHQLDGRVARVAGKTTDAWNLEGIDTTLFDTFSSGTSEEITFGTSLVTATDVSASGGDFDFIDVTTIHDNVRRQIPGISSPATFTFESLWDVSDAGLIALKQASDAQSKRAIRFTFSNGQKVVFLGYVGATLLPQGNAQDKVTTQVVITMDGRPTVLAT